MLVIFLLVDTFVFYTATDTKSVCYQIWFPSNDRCSYIKRLYDYSRMNYKVVLFIAIGCWTFKVDFIVDNSLLFITL